MKTDKKQNIFAKTSVNIKNKSKSELEAVAFKISFYRPGEFTEYTLFIYLGMFFERLKFEGC